MRPFASTEIVMFSGLVSRTSFRSLGSCTGIDVVTTGTVIRKMISSTSITSTRGVVLIVETTSSSSAWPTFIAMASDLGRVLGRAQEHRMQVGREAAHHFHGGLVATNEPVVAKYRGYRHGKADGRHDQRLAHRTGHLVDGRLARDADGREGVIDAPDRSEESDERRGRTDGGEKRQPVLRAALHVLDGTLDQHGDPVVEIDAAQEPDVLAGGLEP